MSYRGIILKSNIQYTLPVLTLVEHTAETSSTLPAHHTRLSATQNAILSRESGSGSWHPPCRPHPPGLGAITGTPCGGRVGPCLTGHMDTG